MYISVALSVCLSDWLTVWPSVRPSVRPLSLSLSLCWVSRCLLKQRYLDYWSYKSCKAPVESAPPTNQHPVFLQTGCRPTYSVKALKGENITFHGPAYFLNLWVCCCEINWLIDWLIDWLIEASKKDHTCTHWRRRPERECSGRASRRSGTAFRRPCSSCRAAGRSSGSAARSRWCVCCGLSRRCAAGYHLAERQTHTTAFTASKQYTPRSAASINLSLRFNDHFPGEPGLAGVYWSKGWRRLVKVKVHTLDIAPLRSETPPQKCSGMTRVLKWSHSFTCTPTRSSAIGMSHTCLCLPSRSWYS